MCFHGQYLGSYNRAAYKDGVLFVLHEATSAGILLNFIKNCQNLTGINPPFIENC